MGARNAVFVVLVTVGGMFAADPPDPLAARKELCKTALEIKEFRFPESDSDSGLLHSLSQSGDFRVHLIYDPKHQWDLEIKIERNGRELVSLWGHKASEFLIVRNVLYFANFDPSHTGCTVIAYDLTSSKKLWETELAAAEVPRHSAYSNRVKMTVERLTDLDKEGEGEVVITGRESAGDYIEVLDQATGKQLAHKVYRQGYAKPK
jgi:hypothetical protein